MGMTPERYESYMAGAGTFLTGVLYILVPANGLLALGSVIDGELPPWQFIAGMNGVVAAVLGLKAYRAFRESQGDETYRRVTREARERGSSSGF
jgi:hypothetical protein